VSEALKKWESISRRLRYVQDQIWSIERNDSRQDGQEMDQKFDELMALFKNHFGCRIANEIYWGTEKR